MISSGIFLSSELDISDLAEGVVIGGCFIGAWGEKRWRARGMTMISVCGSIVEGNVDVGVIRWFLDIAVDST